MSVHNEVDVECEQCGNKFKGTVWTSINAKEDPELKDMLLGGELNMLFCPECSHTFFYEHFLLYIDSRLNLCAYVYPPEEEPQKADLEIMMKRAFVEAQETIPVKDRLKREPELLFGLDELQRLIRELEKTQLTKDVEKARQEPTQ